MIPARPWTVIPHSPLAQLDENLWAVTSAVPGVPGLDRRMTIVNGDGSLLFYNAVPVDAATLEEIRALGRPAPLVPATGTR